MSAAPQPSHQSSHISGCRQPDKFGLGFQITMTDGARTHQRGVGSYTWAGIDNTHFWVDPKNGIGVVIMTQVLPFYNDVSMDVLTRFEKLIYEHVH
ncbi:MAG: serine hydrolase [Acidobacteriota bacterium]